MNRFTIKTLMSVILLLIAGQVMYGGDYYIQLTVNKNISAAGSVYLSDADHSKQGTDVITTGSTSSGTADIDMQANANDGYHFVSWSSCTVASGSTGNASVERDVESSTTNPTYVRLKAPVGSDKTNYYVVTANFAENFYAKITPSHDGHGTANPTVSPSASQNSETSNTNLTFTVTAGAASTGYHFTSWTVNGGTPTSSTSTSPLTVNVLSATTGGSANATNCTVKANYSQNIYYAKLVVNNDGHGTGSVTATPQSTTTQSGNVTFQISATPSAGYHFKNWTKSGSTGSFGNENSSSTTFTAPASANYDEGNATSYTITANFEQDKFYAKLNTAVSSALEGTSAGTAKISSDGGSSYTLDSHTLSASTSGGNVTFKIKATPNKGYQFKGWAETNGSTTYKTTTAQTDYTVKGHTTEGSTSAYNLYAVFDKGTYTVHFLPNDKASRPVTGSMSDQVFTSNVAQNLNALGFVCNVAVTYDAQGGTCSTSSETKSRFTRWKEYVSGSAVANYNDQESVNRSENHGATVNLTATWADNVSFTLPTPTKEHYGQSQTFLGWYDAADGGNRIGGGGDTVNISQNEITLYAHWEICSLVINTTASGSYTSGDRVVFNVTRTETEGIQYHYRISIPIGESRTLKDVPPGTYLVEAENGWSWNYNCSTESAKSATSNTSFNFTLTSKNSSKKHDEKTSTITF